MAKMTLDELRSLRDSKKKEMTQRDGDKSAQIVIGMGTCGIAAGAKDAFDAFLDELDNHEVKDTRITQTGCMGLCFSEPTVEVAVPGMPRVIYGNVDADVARRIVKEHIIGKALVSDHIFDKPAQDIIDGGAE
ncbi:ferredoxin [Pontiella sp.]|uniref:(2Fe-2S) ferredoxin domain-containing protein n=1 Tax=Pontiella sp. TaxID=2837462 RepID=UPI00356777B2